MASLTDSSESISVLERQELPEVARESGLTGASLAGLESAQLLLILESVETETKSLIATRAVDRDNGRILWSDFQPRSGDLEKWVEHLSKKLSSTSLPKIQPDRIRVSIRSLNPEFHPGTSEIDLPALTLTALTIETLSNWPKIDVLERLDLGQIEFERFLTQIDFGSEEQADFTVTGSFQLSGETGNARLTISDNRQAGGTTKLISTEHGGLAELAKQIADLVARETLADDDAARRPPHPLTNRLGPWEAWQFNDEAERNFRLGLYSLAARQAEAANLIDFTDNPRFDAIQIFAELFQLIPSLPALNPDDGFFQVENEYGNRVPLNLWDFYQQDRGEESTPTIPEWEGFNATVKLLTDFTRRQGNRDEEKMRNIARTRLAQIRSVQNSLFEELAWSIYDRQRASSSETEVTKLLELGRNLQELDDAQDEAWPDMDDSWRNPFTAVLLKPTANEGVEYLKAELYPADLDKLGSLPPKDARRRLDRFHRLRDSLLGFLAVARSDNGRILPGQDAALKPFVGAFEGTPMTAEEAFLEAVKPNSDDLDPLHFIDAAFAKIQLHEPGDQRRNAFKDARQALSLHSDFLGQMGLLGSYGAILLSIDNARKLEGGFYQLDEETLPFWTDLHRKAYENSIAGEWQLTSLLETQIANSSLPNEKNPQLQEAVKSLIADLEGFNARVPEESRLNDSYVARFKTKWEPEEEKKKKKTTEGLTGIDPIEHLKISFTVYSYWGAPTLASQTRDNEVYLLKHDIRDAERNADAGIALFRFNEKLSYEFIELPSSVSDLYYQFGENGALDVKDDKISVAAPGAVAIYDRTLKTWSVTENEFLRNKTGFAFIGDRLVCHLGAEFLFQGGPPSQGLYGMDIASGEITTIIDTSRRPSAYILDSAKNLEFKPPILPFGNRFILRIHSAPEYRKESIHVCGFDSPVPQIPPIPSSISIPVDHSDYSTGATLGNTTTLLLQKRLRRDLRETGPNDEFQFAVIAKEVGEKGVRWILDSEFGKNRDPDPSVATYNHEKVEPLYRFPAEFPTQTGTPRSLRPAVWLDERRLLLLSGQLTDDGRRLLYLWRSREQKEPTRIAVAFESYEENKDKGISAEDAQRYNEIASNSIEEISIRKNLIFFRFKYGYFVFRLDELEKYLNGREGE
ncbi:MAG: hypothetical protein KDN19_07415 [Verrucomicrobiae bacterium]|nr:hypothetical protein [Verrucomicrobiae bacterium]